MKQKFHYQNRSQTRAAPTVTKEFEETSFGFVFACARCLNQGYF